MEPTASIFRIKQCQLSVVRGLHNHLKNLESHTNNLLNFGIFSLKNIRVNEFPASGYGM